MAKKKTKKLSVKKETLRQLGALTEDQLRAVAGAGLILAYDPNKILIPQTGICLEDTSLCASIRTGGGNVPTLSCDTKCTIP
jgi:hypothetical protein